MTRHFAVLLLLVLALSSCRDYDYYPHLTADDGLTPPEQFARYGQEQAAVVAIAREFARAHQGEAPEELARQAEAAVRYARSLPQVADVTADPLGHRLTVRFNSGWRTGITPLDD